MALSNQGKRDLKKELDKRHGDEAMQNEWDAREDRNESSRNNVRLQHKEQDNADQQQNVREIRNHEKLKIEEFLKEKKLIDEMVERIHGEVDQALHEKWLKKQKTKDEITAFKESQEVWKELQRKQIERENKKIQDYLMSKQSDVQSWSHEKEQKKQVREMVDCMRQNEERHKQQEMEDIQQGIMEQKRNESANLHELKEVEKRFRQRINIIKDLDSQEKEQEKRKERDAKDEACYRDKIQKNAEEETKLDTMSYEKGRIRKIQLRRDLEDLESGREKKHAENMQFLLKTNDQELKELAERKRKIEEERLTTLKAHAERLIGYMPGGFLFDEDIPLLVDAVYRKQKQNR